MYILWSTQCPTCGVIIVRAPQEVTGAGFAFGRSWCGLCGEPLSEIIQRVGEEKDDAPPKAPRAKPPAPPTDETKETQ